MYSSAGKIIGNASESPNPKLSNSSRKYPENNAKNIPSKLFSKQVGNRFISVSTNDIYGALGKSSNFQSDLITIEESSPSQRHKCELAENPIPGYLSRFKVPEKLRSIQNRSSSRLKKRAAKVGNFVNSARSPTKSSIDSLNNLSTFNSVARGHLQTSRDLKSSNPNLFSTAKRSTNLRSVIDLYQNDLEKRKFQSHFLDSKQVGKSSSDKIELEQKERIKVVSNFSLNEPAPKSSVKKGVSALALIPRLKLNSILQAQEQQIPDRGEIASQEAKLKKEDQSSIRLKIAHKVMERISQQNTQQKSSRGKNQAHTDRKYQRAG